MRRRRMRSKGSRTQGFSLIETMVSALVMAIGVLGATGIYTATAAARADSRALTMAKGVIDQRVEWLVATGYQDYSGCTGPAGCKTDATTLATDLAAAGGTDCTQYVADDTLVTPTSNTPGAYFRVDTVIEEPADLTRFPGVRDAVVSVCWQEADGSVHQLQMRRLISE